MIFRLRCVSKPLVRVAAVLAVGASLSACSSVPGWVDPTSWVGGDDSSSASADDGLLAGQASNQQPDQQIDGQDQSTSQPGLAYIPDRPQPSSTAQERQQVASSLAADRAHQQYSSEQLRGDAQTSSAPPPQEQDVASAQLPPAAAPTTAVATSAAPAIAGQTRAAAPQPQQYASSGGEPAVPASSSDDVTSGSLGVSPSNAQLGFKPSKAPPLDPSVSQFVAPSIVSRFQQTAAVGPQSVAAPAVTAGGEGGPDQMSGAVVANLGAIRPSPAVRGADGLPPAQVVFFPHDTTVLNSEGRKLVRAAAETFRQKGAQGYIRVVGHSSSRTANMPLARHIELNFERSQARATAVAKELIRDGVPAEKVLVEAVGDSQPVYYESMPKGEEGNRRAEIFIQG
jgi:flagellar motor protein MotB